LNRDGIFFALFPNLDPLLAFVIKTHTLSMNFSKLLRPTLFFGIAAAINFSANAQCEITSEDSYLLSDDPVTLTATPDGRFF
jgi:hypothetical protein